MRKKFTRRGKALAASGAVIGLGAVTTLAAWTDAEWAMGSFLTGGFQAQASPTKDFGDPSEVLNFNFTDGKIQPDVPVSATHWLRVKNGNAATVTLGRPQFNNSDSNDIADRFNATVEKGACGATTDTLQGPDKLTAISNTVTDALALPAPTEDAPGEAQAFCFTVVLPKNNIQDLQPGDYTSGKVTWPVTVTEVSQ